VPLKLIPQVPLVVTGTVMFQAEHSELIAKKIAVVNADENMLADI
jgi:hypothetical protein